MESRRFFFVAHTIYVRHVDIVDKQSWHGKILVVCQGPCRMMILHVLRRERFAKQYGISITGPLLRNMDAEMNPSVAKLQIFLWYLKQQHTSTSWEQTYPLPVWHFWVDCLPGFPNGEIWNSVPSRWWWNSSFWLCQNPLTLLDFGELLSLWAGTATISKARFWKNGSAIMKGFKGSCKRQTFQLCRTRGDCFIWQYQIFWIQLQDLQLQWYNKQLQWVSSSM